MAEGVNTGVGVAVGNGVNCRVAEGVTVIGPVVAVLVDETSRVRLLVGVPAAGEVPSGVTVRVLRDVSVMVGRRVIYGVRLGVGVWEGTAVKVAESSGAGVVLGVHGKDGSGVGVRLDVGVWEGPAVKVTESSGVGVVLIVHGKDGSGVGVRLSTGVSGVRGICVEVKDTVGEKVLVSGIGVSVKAVGVGVQVEVDVGLLV